MNTGRLIRRQLGKRSLQMCPATTATTKTRSEEHTSELQSQSNLVCRLLLEKKKKKKITAKLIKKKHGRIYSGYCHFVDICTLVAALLRLPPGKGQGVTETVL